MTRETSAGPASGAPNCQRKPRNFYLDKAHLKWSKDKTKAYFESAEEKVIWPLIKICGLALAFASSSALLESYLSAVVVCLGIAMTYQHVIALIVPNTIVMPALDLQTFYSNPH